MFCEASKVSRAYVWTTEQRPPFCLQKEGNVDILVWDKNPKPKPHFEIRIFLYLFISFVLFQKEIWDFFFLYCAGLL